MGAAGSVRRLPATFEEPVKWFCRWCECLRNGVAWPPRKCWDRRSCAVCLAAHRARPNYASGPAMRLWRSTGPFGYGGQSASISSSVAPLSLTTMRAMALTTSPSRMFMTRTPVAVRL